MTETRRPLLVIIAWLQLIASIAFAVVLVWGYAAYQSSLGQIVQSIAASLGAVSNVVARTAETVEGRRELLNESAKLLTDTRKVIDGLLVAGENQAALIPQHAKGLQSLASVIGKTGGLLQALGDRMMVLSAPSGIRWEGGKPIVIMSRPMEEQAKELVAIAKDAKAVSESMASIATTVGRDVPKVNADVVATGKQALKVIADAEKALEQIKVQDLPKAIEELKATSKALNVVSSQVDTLGNGGIVLLVAGLILAVWCFLNSLGFLMLVNANRPLPKQGNLVSG